jgi:hypothetical protein
MHTLAVEIAPFTLKADITETALFEHSDRLEREFLSKMPGYLGRSLARLGEGQWADIVLWRSEEHAAAVMPLVHASSACAAYFHCMVGADVQDAGAGVSLFRAVRTYGALEHV